MWNLDGELVTIIYFDSEWRSAAVCGVSGWHTHSFQCTLQIYPIRVFSHLSFVHKFGYLDGIGWEFGVYFTSEETNIIVYNHCIKLCSWSAKKDTAMLQRWVESTNGGWDANSCILKAIFWTHTSTDNTKRGEKVYRNYWIREKSCKFNNDCWLRRRINFFVRMH